MSDDRYPRDYARVVRYTAADAEPEPEPCPNCQTAVYPDQLVTTGANGEQGCDNCTQACDHCDNLEFSADFVPYGRYRPGRQREMVCEPCSESDDFSNCADCDGLFHTDDLNDRNPSGDHVCNRCAESYFTCEDCDGVFHEDDYGSDGRCAECEGERARRNSSDLIHKYDYSPDDLQFHGEGRHYGVELETVLKSGDLNEVAEDTLNKLNAGLDDEGFAYLKKDASLDEGIGGFEIVTHPATLDIHKERWANFLGSNAPRNLVSHDTNCCGLHVHVERKGLSDLTVGKILSFVNANNNRKFIEEIARRSSDRYAKLDPSKKPQDVRKKNTNRYEAVNLQNDDTLEFRIFKGTLKPESFYRSLEFVDAVVEYAKPATASLKSMVGVDGFFEFVAANHERYPHLFPFCEKFAGKELRRKPKPKKFAREEPVLMSVRMIFRQR